MNKNIRSFLRFGAFLLILVLVVLLANAVLIQTDTYSALPLAELKSRDDIDLAVVGSSIVGEHLNANLVSEQTGLTAFSASVPSLSLQGEIALTREIYRKNSPAYTVLSLEPYNLNSAKEYTSAYYRLTPYLSSWRDKITYYLDACREDGLYLDRLFMFREFGVESLSDILKTVGLRLNPLKTYEKLKPTLDDTVTYEGSGFLRYDREPDVADLVREKLQREEMPDGYVYELLEPTKALLLRYKALCEEKGSQLMILLFPNLTAHALAEPEYLPYCESLMAFCRENGIPCYNFQYVKGRLHGEPRRVLLRPVPPQRRRRGQVQRVLRALFQRLRRRRGRGRLVLRRQRGIPRFRRSRHQRMADAARRPVCRGLQSGHAGHAAVSLLPLHGRRADPSARLQRG
ncbi:MAG: hypothetical protein V8Q88_08980 [Christensenellales bacterium]